MYRTIVEPIVWMYGFQNVWQLGYQRIECVEGKKNKWAMTLLPIGALSRMCGGKKNIKWAMILLPIGAITFYYLKG